MVDARTSWPLVDLVLNKEIHHGNNGGKETELGHEKVR